MSDTEHRGSLRRPPLVSTAKAGAETGADARSSYRVVLIDDHPIVTDGLLTLINQTSDLRVVGAFEDSAVALARLSDLQPDVVITDIQMPGLNGVAVTQRIRAEHPQIRVIVLSQS